MIFIINLDKNEDHKSSYIKLIGGLFSLTPTEENLVKSIIESFISVYEQTYLNEKANFYDDKARHVWALIFAPGKRHISSKLHIKSKKNVYTYIGSLKEKGVLVNDGDITKLIDICIPRREVTLKFKKAE